MSERRGENENVRIWLELCSKLGGRENIAFQRKMVSGDAYLWTKFRNGESVLKRFKALPKRNSIKT